MGDGVKLYNGGDTKRNGVAIAVVESLKDYISALNRISERIIAVRIDRNDGYWTMFAVYAPQAGKSKSEKNEFHLGLDDA